jgi:hypothetical protein
MNAATSEITEGGWRDRYVDRSIRTLWRHETLLWTIAICAALGDVVTTAYGLQMGLTEGNPIMHAMIAESGIAGLVGSKFLVIGLAFALGTVLFEGKRRVVVPLGLALPWLFVTVSNAFLLL